MIEETPAEKEERLQRREERLQRQHERLKEGHPSHSSRGSSSGGSFKEVFSFFEEHKVITIAVIAIVLLLLALNVFNNNSQSGTVATSGPNASPNYAASGYMSSGTASALDNINSTLQSMMSQIASLGQQQASSSSSGSSTTGSGTSSSPGVGSSTGSSGPSGLPKNPTGPLPPPNTGTTTRGPSRPVSIPPVHVISTGGNKSSGGNPYVIVQKWPAQMSTLWGISQAEGISLSRIESLNPQISNPNLIYPGQKVYY
jgi:hypothetical protein